jgi:alginate O-acetyltransferase complex protein AlgJ
MTTIEQRNLVRPIAGALFATALIALFAAFHHSARAVEATDLQTVASAKARKAMERNETAVAGTDGWLFLTAELRHLGVGKFWGDAASAVSRATSPDKADPLPAILDFHQQLRATGVELWIVPVPPKALMNPERLGALATVRGHHPAYDDFYALLRKEGITVVDLRDAWKQHNGADLYCRTDSHWSGQGIVSAARVLAERIKTNGWHTATARTSFVAETREVSFTGDLARGGDQEALSVQFTGTSEGNRLSPVAPADGSPVLLLGDSHNLVFHSGGDMHARGAGLPDQLGYELGFPVDLIAVRGSGATPARINLMRKARRDPDWRGSKAPRRRLERRGLGGG